jgi:hypothetical protein
LTVLSTARLAQWFRQQPEKGQSPVRLFPWADYSTCQTPYLFSVQNPSAVQPENRGLGGELDTLLPERVLKVYLGRFVRIATKLNL